MKEEALALAAATDHPARKLNILREYLQALVLRSLHESEAAQNLVFVGGTALRFLHQLPRFSEDLDFSLATADGYQPVAWMNKLQRDLKHAGFTAKVEWNDRRTVHSAWIHFTSLLKEVRLSALPGQKLSIKLEIDTRPPAGGLVEKTLLTRHFTFVIRHHDLASLMSGKIHALIARPYAKGRDWFDFLWYCSLRPTVSPNLALLRNALTQTDGAMAPDAAKWVDLVRSRVANLDIAQLGRDVGPFLERTQDLSLLTRENLEVALGNQGSHTT